MNGYLDTNNFADVPIVVIFVFDVLSDEDAETLGAADTVKIDLEALFGADGPSNSFEALFVAVQVLEIPKNPPESIVKPNVSFPAMIDWTGELAGAFDIDALPTRSSSTPSTTSTTGYLAV